MTEGPYNPSQVRKFLEENQFECASDAISTECEHPSTGVRVAMSKKSVLTETGGPGANRYFTHDCVIHDPVHIKFGDLGDNDQHYVEFWGSKNPLETGAMCSIVWHVHPVIGVTQ